MLQLGYYMDTGIEAHKWVLAAAEDPKEAKKTAKDKFNDELVHGECHCDCVFHVFAVDGCKVVLEDDVDNQNCDVIHQISQSQWD